MSVAKRINVFDFESSLQLVESVQLLHDFFDDNDKVARWLCTANPFLGQCVPIEMFYIGRGHKALQFIKSCKLENNEDV